MPIRGLVERVIVRASDTGMVKISALARPMRPVAGKVVTVEPVEA